MFKGSYTALITPFKDGAVDEDAYRKFIAWQISEGTHGLVPVGTTGESPTLSPEEHKRIVEIAVDAAGGKVPVMAGAGSNATSEAVDFATHAEKAGASSVLVVTPYYNKPSQDGLYEHYKAINDAVSIPIIIYNIPGRSIVDMTVETMAHCFELKNVTGVKDATADIARVSQQRAAMGPEFNQLSGEDATALGYMAHGGHGCISVASNVAPRLCSEFQNACLAGDFAKALTIQDRLMPLHDAMFCESSPGPVKYAVSRLGFCEPTARLPMVPITDRAKAIVDAALEKVGLVGASAAA